MVDKDFKELYFRLQADGCEGCKYQDKEMNFITEMLDLFYAIKHLYKKIGGANEQIH